MARKLKTGYKYLPESNYVDPEHRILFADLKPNGSAFYRFVKRAFDVVSSCAALICLSPLFIGVAIAIKSDGGSVFFMQERIGKDGKPFLMYKFRSMVPNAEQMLKELKEKQNDTDGPVFKLFDDPRVTKVGKFIRRYSIDELPQLINILRGEMSVVGPRPALPSEVAEYSDYDRKRLLVTPGLTCYWQCNGRSRIKFEKWVDMDLEYINDQKIRTDISIIIRTIPAVFRGDGAC